jgi:SAM-dependent methyltransferase
VENADELYPSRLPASALDERLFSARRLPDRVHFRVVRCRDCGLIRSDPIAPPEQLRALYERSTFDYGDQVPYIRTTYARYLARVEERQDARAGLLEIGCGNGFMLEEALERGWGSVTGVEPSANAIARAPARVRGAIVKDVMRPGLFEPQSFDAVCLFQVLDHLPDPLETLRECHRVLRPGGHILALNHNAASLSARLLGERSPIFDVEHTFLYSPETIRVLLERAGFTAPAVETVRNTYSLSYLTHLLPLPAVAKTRLLPRVASSRLGRLTLTVPLGNLCAVARRA